MIGQVFSQESIGSFTRVTADWQTGTVLVCLGPKPTDDPKSMSNTRKLSTISILDMTVYQISFLLHLGVGYVQVHTYKIPNLLFIILLHWQCTHVSGWAFSTLASQDERQSPMLSLLRLPLVCPGMGIRLDSGAVTCSTPWMALYCCFKFVKSTVLACALFSNYIFWIYTVCICSYMINKSNNLHSQVML